MGARSTEEVKREIESERKQLGDAVGVLRRQANAVRRKLPLIAVGAAGMSLAARTVQKRVFRSEPSGKEKRGCFPFRKHG